MSDCRCMQRIDDREKRREMIENRGEWGNRGIVRERKGARGH